MSQNETVYLNGNYTQKEKAKLSVLDRGFLFGDGVYELIPVYNQHIFYIENHIKRLKNSLDLIHINPSIIEDIKIIDIIKELIIKNNYVNHYIYIHISRGVDEARNHIYTKSCKPTVLIMGENYTPFSKQDIQKGKHAITENDYRWLRSNIKSTSLLANVLIKNKAYNEAAYEALLIRDGYLTEGSASNVFIVNDNVIKTPLLSNKLLPGITRKFLTDLIKKHNLEFSECEISEKDLFDSDEIFCSSSTNPVVPITKLDNMIVSEEAGPISMKMYDYTQDFIKEFYS